MRMLCALRKTKKDDCKEANVAASVMLALQDNHSSLFFLHLKHSCSLTRYLTNHSFWRKISNMIQCLKITQKHCLTETFSFSKTRQNGPICKRSSLRSQCWIRLFLWFSNTVHDLRIVALSSTWNERWFLQAAHGKKRPNLHQIYINCHACFSSEFACDVRSIFCHGGT